MIISTEINSASAIVGEERAVELVAKAGFDAWDFSMFGMCNYDWTNKILLPSEHPLAGPDYLKFARKLRKIGEDNGIFCNQSHAPYPSSCAELRSYFKRAIECTAEAGGKICVIHPDNDLSPQENAEMYMEVLPFAKECGVKIATENMWNWDWDKDEALPAACSDHKNFYDHIKAINDEFFVACLDIGHAEMRGLNTNSVDMIKTLGSSLKALHIHDNDKHDDSHQIPFSMDIDFEPIVKALKEIGYSGEFTLETNAYLNGYTAENVLDGLRDMAKAARRLADMFESL